MITQLLPANELELPLDGSVTRGKRKCSCIPLTINTILCLITCLAALVCVTYASWAISEISNAKKIQDAKKEADMTTDNQHKQNHAKHQQFQRQTTAEDTQTDTDFGFDWAGNSAEDDTDLKTVQETASDGNEGTNDIGGMRTDSSNKQNPSQLQQFQRQTTTNHSATKIPGADGSGTHVERTESSQDVQENTDFGFDWTEHSTEEDDTDYKTAQDAASDGNEDTNDIDQDEEDTYENEYDYYYTDLDDDSYNDVDDFKDEMPIVNSHDDWGETSTDKLHGSGDNSSDDEV